MTDVEEIRKLVKEVEAQVEAGILPSGNCLFDPLKVKLALEFVLSVLAKSHPAKAKESN